MAAVLGSLVVLVSGGLTGCGPPAEESQVLVIVNGKPVTHSEFEYRWSQLSESAQARYRREGGKRKFLDDLIMRELLLQEARKRGLDQSPDVLERLERFKEQLALDELMKEVAKTQVELSNEELEAYYASHLADPKETHGTQVSRERLRQELYAEKRRKQFEDFLTKLRAKAVIRMAEASRFVTEDTGRPPAVPVP